MSVSRGIPVEDDIVDRILTFSPSFDALQSTILVSKSFRDVFQARPNSIIRTVAYNVVGPALPHLLTFIRAKERPSSDEPLPLDVEEISPITNDEIKLLPRYTRVAAGLEAMFSQR